MKKLIMAIVSVMLVLFVATADYEKEFDGRTIPEKIMDSVVAVEQSSGIIIHSEYNRAFVLTAYHTIEDIVAEAACCGCDYDINVFNLKNIPFMLGLEKFSVINIDIDVHNDLAIIEVYTNRKLSAVKISKRDIKYGDKVYVAGNPNSLYKSLKQGIVSSPLRFISGKFIMEVDAGIIYGSSGGGVFGEDGKLLGTVRSVGYTMTDYCYDVFDEKGDWEQEVCFELPLYFMGFAVPKTTIIKFLLNGKFKDDFAYLR